MSCPNAAKPLPRFKQVGIAHRPRLIMLELVWFVPTPCSTTHSRVYSTSQVASKLSVIYWQRKMFARAHVCHRSCRILGKGGGIRAIRCRYRSKNNVCTESSYPHISPLCVVARWQDSRTFTLTATQERSFCYGISTHPWCSSRRTTLYFFRNSECRQQECRENLRIHSRTQAKRFRG